MNLLFAQLKTIRFKIHIIDFILPKIAVIFTFWIPCGFLILFASCVTEKNAHLPKKPSPNFPFSVESPRTLLKQGDDHYQVGEFAKAIVKWKAAYELNESGNYTYEQSKILLKLSEAYQVIGQFEKAVASLEKAMISAQNSEDQVQIAAISSQLGSLYLGVGDMHKAIKYLNEGLIISQKIDRKSLTANLLNNIGNLYASEKKYSDAIDAYQESIILSDNCGDQKMAVTAMINLSKAAISNGQPAMAKKQLQEAFDKIRKLEDSHLKASLAINVGITYWDLQPYVKKSKKQVLMQTYQFFQVALQVAKRINDERTYCYALGYLGRIYEDSDQFQEALKLTGRAAYLAQKNNIPEAFFQWQWQEGRIFNTIGEIDDAIASYRGAIYTLQLIRNEKTGCYDSFGSSMFQTVENVTFELADLLLKRAASSDDEKIRQEYLLDARQVIELRKVYELRNYYQDDCVDAANAGVTKLEDVSKTAVVIYPIFLKDRVEILASFPTGLKSFLVSMSAEKITDEVLKFRKLLEKRTTREYFPLACKLYDWLIRPMESDLKSIHVDTLVFVPDGPLRTIPMAALHNGERFLIEDYAIATTPGLNLIDPQPIVQKSPKVLLMALTQSVQGFSSLPYIFDEIETIKTIFPVKVLLNENFRVSRMETALRDQQYGILHIATHAKFENDAEKTFIVAYDGSVSIDDLDQYIGLLQFRDDPLEMLTLSACETAAGDDKAALGLAGIAIKAGARSAFASLWQINDLATSKLIEKFYYGLKDPSNSKAKSLQSAQLSLMDDSRFDHPGYWASFILINNWL